MPKTRANYDEDFRRKAVDLLIGGGRPLKEVSRDLGVSANALRQWRNRALGVHLAGGAKTVAAAPAATLDAAAEIRRLQREVEHLRRQRDILKKAMSILGEEPQAGMR